MIFNPKDAEDTKDKRILMLHDTHKFTRLPSEIGYSYEITGANGVKNISTGEVVDLQDIDISGCSLFIRLFDAAGNKVDATKTNYVLWKTFSMHVILEVYE